LVTYPPTSVDDPDGYVRDAPALSKEGGGVVIPI
jgi:hypothetical protein